MPVAAWSSPPLRWKPFCMEHGIPARRRMLEDFDIYEAERSALFRGDFFALTPALLGVSRQSTIARR